MATPLAPAANGSYQGAPNINAGPSVQTGPSGAGNVTVAGVAPASTTQSAYPVVTSNAATQNYNGIQQAYQGIAANAQTAAANTQAANSAPTVAGYNVSATPTGNQGETKLQQNGMTYYITPQDKPLTAGDLQNILSGGTLSNDTANTGTNGTTQVQNTTGTQTTNTSDTTGTQTPVQSAQSSTGINPTTENSQYSAALSQDNTDLTNAYNTFNSSIQNIMSGAFPLSPAQQSLVDATNQAFQQMGTQANLKAAALSSETGGVSDKINATAGQLLNITSEQSAAIAKLELGFQDQNYKAVTDAYTAFKDLETQKMTALKDAHDSVMATYNSAVSAAQAQQTYQATQIKNAADLAQSQYEFRDAKDAMGNTIGTQVFDKATGKVVETTSNGASPESGTPTTTVGVDPTTGTANPDQQAAFLATIPTAFQALVQGIANGKIEPPTARTKNGAQILGWVAQYDPSLSNGTGGFDATKYASRAAYLKNLTSGTLSQGITSANKVIDHLSTYLKDSSSLPVGAVNPFNINALEVPIEGGISAMVGNNSIQSTESAASQVSNGLTDEMTKFFKGTGGTDVSSLESWSKGLNPYNSPGTQKGVVQGTLDLFSGQLNSMLAQYKSTMGRDANIGEILQPQTLATLSNFKNQGYNIDIPGVNYTDPIAYTNASPDNASELSAVRTAYPDLTPAQALQLAQFNQNGQ